MPAPIIITLRALVCIFRSQVRTAGDKITVFQLVSAIGGRQYKLMLCREKPPAALQWGKKELTYVHHHRHRPYRRRIYRPDCRPRRLAGDPLPGGEQPPAGP
ncbi:hypothetical protein KPNJ1_02861 [Klebsiella pneumoniae 30660/NJST258_1]|uniref:Uncharacterized protein n=1 Tax=Klebsiella pneumoniae 30684/NJST258_2 TaxID=1420013 RepID=W8UIB3_KLEPN|nr:hypothetical protein KPNJ2_02834 [Klebsiella pneumoniae 30684/NJST258_2]AHM85267.1 hypothetical protein KPNJ1_02861 [Klebsiella pneumoniae 30660/NJST258_1]